MCMLLQCKQRHGKIHILTFMELKNGTKIGYLGPSNLLSLRNILSGHKVKTSHPAKLTSRETRNTPLPSHTHLPSLFFPEWKCGQGWLRVLLSVQNTLEFTNYSTHFNTFELSHRLITCNYCCFTCVVTEMEVSTHVPPHSERAQPCPSTESQRYFSRVKCHCHLTLFCPHDILEKRGRGEEARRRADSPPGRAEGEGTLLDPEAGPATEPGQ